MAVIMLSSILCMEKGPRRDTYGEAIKQCSKHGDGPFLSELVQTGLMEKWKGHKFWLPYRRVVYDSFFWVDGTKADFSLDSMGHDIGYSCGEIDFENDHYDFQPCHQGGSSFICHIPGCSTCRSINKDPNECLILRNECFTYQCGSINWYRARETCKKQGGDLAIVKDVSDIPIFHKFWKPSYDNPCSTTWIGLNREKWLAKEGGEPNATFWDEGEPKLHGECSIISMEKSDIVWQVVPCEDKYWYFCNDEKTTATALITEGETSAPADGSIKMIEGFIFIIILCMLIMIGMQIFTIMMYKSKETAVKRNSSTLHEREEVVSLQTGPKPSSTCQKRFYTKEKITEV